MYSVKMRNSPPPIAVCSFSDNASKYFNDCGTTTHDSVALTLEVNRAMSVRSNNKLLSTTAGTQYYRLRILNLVRLLVGVGVATVNYV